MKITGSTPLQGVYGATGTRRSASPTRTSSGPAAQVSISSDAAFVSELRAQARELQGTVRSDVVQQIRGQLADGSFEAGVDMDHVIDGLFGDL